MRCEEESKVTSIKFDCEDEEDEDESIALKSESFAQRKQSPPKAIVKKPSFTELIGLQSSAGFWQPSSLATLQTFFST